MTNQEWIEYLKSKIGALKEVLKNQIFMQPDYHSEKSLTIYEVAKGSLGRHLTLNNNVPPELGCAEAVSAVLIKSGITGIPPKGFEGTNDLYTFLQESPLFVDIANAEDGAIIVSPSKIGANGQITTHGHVGICAKYGILSNESDNGLFAEKFSYQSWNDYYVHTLGLPVYFFRAV